MNEEQPDTSDAFEAELRLVSGLDAQMLRRLLQATMDARPAEDGIARDNPARPSDAQTPPAAVPAIFRIKAW